jgi:hypothetical protein
MNKIDVDPMKVLQKVTIITLFTLIWDQNISMRQLNCKNRFKLSEMQRKWQASNIDPNIKGQNRRRSGE